MTWALAWTWILLRWFLVREFLDFLLNLDDPASHIIYLASHSTDLVLPLFNGGNHWFTGFIDSLVETSKSLVEFGVVWCSIVSNRVV